jgi:hypothetical protein
MDPMDPTFQMDPTDLRDYSRQQDQTDPKDLKLLDQMDLKDPY